MIITADSKEEEEEQQQQQQQKKEKEKKDEGVFSHKSNQLIKSIGADLR